jgi:hypothetical protein
MFDWLEDDDFDGWLQHPLHRPRAARKQKQRRMKKV